MVNPHKGEVEIDLRKAVAQQILQPANHGKVHLKYTLESLGNIETELRRMFGWSISVFEILDRNNKNPEKISIAETAVMLEHGLRDQFPAMNLSIAYKVLGCETMTDVLAQIMTAMNIAFEGVVPVEIKEDVDQKEFTETLVEGVEGEAKK